MPAVGRVKWLWLREGEPAAVVKHNAFFEDINKEVIAVFNLGVEIFNAVKDDIKRDLQAGIAAKLVLPVTVALFLYGQDLGVYNNKNIVVAFVFVCGAVFYVGIVNPVATGKGAEEYDHLSGESLPHGIHNFPDLRLPLGWQMINTCFQIIGLKMIVSADFYFLITN